MEIKLKHWEIDNAADFIRRKIPDVEITPVELLVQCRKLNKGFRGVVEHWTAVAEQMEQENDKIEGHEGEPGSPGSGKDEVAG